jgi:hypothetical protein
MHEQNLLHMHQTINYELTLIQNFQNLTCATPHALKVYLDSKWILVNCMKVIKELICLLKSC